MAIRIEIFTVFEAGPEKEQIEASMEALGFHRTLPGQITPSASRDIYAEVAEKLQSSTKIAEQEIEAAEQRVDETPLTSVQQSIKDGSFGVKSAEPNRSRERGKPAPGRARRTKEEIAEDTAWYAAQGQTETSDESSGMSISSDEERISPEDAETVQQDAADEAAETERTGGLAPRERLRKALGALGIKAGVESVKPGGLIGMTVDQVPDDEIEAIIAKLEAAKAAPAETKQPEKKAATKDDLMQAMLDYAEIFDGTRNPADAKLAQVDAGEVFKLLFGPDVSKLSAVPADGYDKAIAGIREAIAKNPFKRTRQNG